jgi:hypothetical protein
MASLQRFRVQGHSYWRIVESRRVKGRPTIRVVAYLGKADNLLARLRIPLIVSAGSGIVSAHSGDREHAVGAKRRYVIAVNPSSDLVA